VIEEALDEKKFRLELKYRGTRDGFSASNFHKLIDGMDNTLTVVDSEHGFRFGGYTSVKFGSSNSRVPDPNGVIFSLTKKSIHRQYQNQKEAFYPGNYYLGCYYDFGIKDICNT
jgi:hypothetical protein